MSDQYVSVQIASDILNLNCPRISIEQLDALFKNIIRQISVGALLEPTGLTVNILPIELNTPLDDMIQEALDAQKLGN